MRGRVLPFTPEAAFGALQRATSATSRKDTPVLLSRRRCHFYGAIVLLVFATTTCAHQPLPSASLDFTQHLAGFVEGLFHGFTLVFNLVASLIFDVRIYQFPNSGRLYDLGYVIGASAFLGGSTTASRSRAAAAGA